jgi:hypothetical protein
VPQAPRVELDGGLHPPTEHKLQRPPATPSCKQGTSDAAAVGAGCRCKPVLWLAMLARAMVMRVARRGRVLHRVLPRSNGQRVGQSARGGLLQMASCTKLSGLLLRNRSPLQAKVGQWGQQLWATQRTREWCGIVILAHPRVWPPCSLEQLVVCCVVHTAQPVNVRPASGVGVCETVHVASRNSANGLIVFLAPL